MNDLRLALFLIGIFIVVVIYLWGLIRNRRQQRRHTILQSAEQQELGGLRIRTRPEPDDELSISIRRLNTGETEAGQDRNGYITTALQLPDKTPQEQPGNTAIQSQTAPELIITLHVSAFHDNNFTGPELLDALNMVGMEYGAMDIFHHYGIGEMRSTRPLFSLANMLEPGHFNLATMQSLATPGITLFMCIPAPVDGQVVFELMLNTAQRLATILNGEVLGPDRNVICDEYISDLRNEIRNAIS